MDVVESKPTESQMGRVKEFLLASMGYFTGSYNLSCLSLVTRLLGRIYYGNPHSPRLGTLPLPISVSVSGSAIIGTLVGQLLFIWGRDKLSKKLMCHIIFNIMIISSIFSGLSFSKSPKSIIATLCVSRFLLGVSIGCEYSWSGATVAQYIKKNSRKAFVVGIYSMQGFGIQVAGIVSMSISIIFRRTYPTKADFIWRIILMAGSLPSIFIYYLRVIKISNETNLLKENVSEIVDKHDEFGIFSKKFIRSHGLSLLGTVTTYLFIGIISYCQQTYQKDALSSIGILTRAENMSAIDEVYEIGKVRFLFAICTVLGNLVTLALVDKIGCYAIQSLGFIFMAIFMFALAVPYRHWTLTDDNIGFIIIYGLSLFFTNFGPNISTLIIPTELFPAHLSSTCVIISSVAGKVGAVAGAFGFSFAFQIRSRAKVNHKYQGGGIDTRNLLMVLAWISLLGFVFTFLVRESKETSSLCNFFNKSKSSEDISKDNQGEIETAEILVR